VHLFETGNHARLVGMHSQALLRLRLRLRRKCRGAANSCDLSVFGGCRVLFQRQRAQMLLKLFYPG
jgi:hypothetical protein